MLIELPCMFKVFILKIRQWSSRPSNSHKDWCFYVLENSMLFEIIHIFEVTMHDGLCNGRCTTLYDVMPMVHNL